MRVRLGTSFGLQDRDITQVPVKLVIIQAKPDHEVIWDFEPSVIYGDLDDAAGVPVKERADRQGVGSAAGERLEKISQSEAGVDDIFHQNHIFTFDALVEVFGDPNESRSPRSIRET